jgi:hypothetical protein
LVIPPAHRGVPALLRTVKSCNERALPIVLSSVVPMHPSEVAQRVILCRLEWRKGRRGWPFLAHGHGGGVRSLDKRIARRQLDGRFVRHSAACNRWRNRFHANGRSWRWGFRCFTVLFLHCLVVGVGGEVCAWWCRSAVRSLQEKTDTRKPDSTDTTHGGLCRYFDIPKNNEFFPGFFAFGFRLFLSPGHTPTAFTPNSDLPSSC